MNYLRIINVLGFIKNNNKKEVSVESCQKPLKNADYKDEDKITKERCKSFLILCSWWFSFIFFGCPGWTLIKDEIVSPEWNYCNEWYDQ